jgi:hypothetical protein
MYSTEVGWERGIAAPLYLHYICIKRAYLGVGMGEEEVSYIVMTQAQAVHDRTEIVHVQRIQGIAGLSTCV